MSATDPVLSAAEHAVAESILSDAWNEPVEVATAEMVWTRRHVVRLVAHDGRSAILKRLHRGDVFGVELASLEFLGGMPDPVAPRLLGADVTAGILIMEELPPGRSLAHSLLGSDRDGARFAARVEQRPYRGVRAPQPPSLVGGADRQQPGPLPPYRR